MPVTKRRKTKLSEEVIRKQRPAVDIQKSAQGNADAVAEDLRDFLLRGLPEGQSLPDVALLQVILGNIVVHDSQAMEDADEAHFDALSRLNRLQLVRDAYRGGLVPTLVEIRDTFDTAFGTDSCQRVLGLGVELPAETLRVRRLGDRVVRLLGADDFELPPPVSDIASVDIEKWVKNLKPDLEGLHESMDQISEAKREAERTLAAKKLAVETYQQTYLRGSQLLETLYRVSGNEHLADKLRPTIPKSRSSAAGGESDPSGSPEPAAEGDGSPTSPEGAAEPTARPDRPPSEARPPEIGLEPPISEVRPDRPPVEAPSAETRSAETRSAETRSTPT